MEDELREDRTQGSMDEGGMVRVDRGLGEVWDRCGLSGLLSSGRSPEG